MMEEFTSLEPENEIITDITYQWDSEVEIMEEVPEIWNQEEVPEIWNQEEVPESWNQGEILEEQNLFLSDQGQIQSSSQTGEDQTSLLIETREIKDLLRGYLVETTTEGTTEETTDYVGLIYKEVKRQNDNISSLEGKVITIAKDQQTIGLLSVGASVLLIGALGVFFFLWRVR